MGTAPPEPSPATIPIDVSPEVVVGSQFTATVLLDGIANLGAYQLTAAFDSSGLRLISVQDGGFLPSSGRQPSCQTAPSPAGGMTLYA